MLTRTDLKRYCSNVVYNRGYDLFMSASVADIDIEDSDFASAHVSAMVTGTRGYDYSVSLTVDESRAEITDADCDCPAFDQFGGLCKHCVALALEYIDEMDIRRLTRSRQGASAGTSASRRDEVSAAKVSTGDVAATIDAVLDRIIRQNASSGGPNLERAGAAARKKRSAGGADKHLTTSSAIDKLIYSYATDDGLVLRDDEMRNIEIVPELHLTETYTGISDIATSLTLKIGASRKYVVKGIGALIDDFAGMRDVSYGKDLRFVHDRRLLSPKSRKLLGYIERIIENRDNVIGSRDRYGYGYGYSYGYGTPHGVGKSLQLSGPDVCDLLDLYQGDSLAFVDDVGQQSSSYTRVSVARQAKRSFDLRVVDGDPDLQCKVTSTSSGDFSIDVPDDLTWYHDADRLYVRLGDTAYRCTPAYIHDMMRFFQAVGYRLPRLSNERLVVAEKDMAGFCASVLPVLREHAELDVPEGIDTFIPAPPQFSFYLDIADGFVTCIPYVSYAEQRFNLCAPVAKTQLYRDLRREGAALAAVSRYFVDQLDSGEGFRFPDDDLPTLVRLMEAGTDELGLIGDVYLSDALKRIAIRSTPVISVGVSLETGLLDIDISAEGIDFAELRAYLDAYRRKRRFHRLKNGEIVRLDEGGIKQLSDVLEGLDIDPSRLKDGKVKVPGYRALYLDGELDGADGISFDRDATFRSFIREFDRFDEGDYRIPTTLQGVLRSYQEVGFRWLAMLDRLGFGGILADEMGLGKTIQVIALLLYKKEQRAGYAATAAADDASPLPEAASSVLPILSTDDLPSLVVCPASLIYNWVSEFNRFAPSLSVVPVVGTQGERAGIVAHAGDHDVLVTSYDLIKRDMAAYADARFSCMVIDEAQYIKNPLTQSAHAVKAINAATRFALTGTPIENRLSELWSIFDFLMPGFLGNHARFEANYEKPITLAAPDDPGRREATRRLQATIKPFVLRRLKSAVLTDLPEKTENIIRSRMEGEQRKLYDATATQLKLMLEKQLPDEFQRGKIAVLAELTKLREICCDPHLLFSNYRGESAKLDTCMELVDQAIDGGHRVLLFSQFTSMLDIIAAELNDRKINYFMLTGSTSKERRAELVRAFADGHVPVFLISLKAGGTGLNLTAADIVIHFDPWWNLAAQNQATDRAHRIGQEREVGVFKIIAEDSIEERIIALQENKRDLADRVLGGDGMGAASLSRDDLLALLEG